MSATADNLKDEAEKAVDEAKQTATDSADETEDKAKGTMKKVVPEESSGGSG